MFIVARFTTVRTWKQPKHPSAEGWIKKTWYIYATEYYSAIKWNRTVPFADVDGHGDGHTKRGQKEKKNKPCMISFMCGIQKKMVQMNLCTKEKQETQM